MSACISVAIKEWTTYCYEWVKWFETNIFYDINKLYYVGIFCNKFKYYKNSVYYQIHASRKEPLGGSGSAEDDNKEEDKMNGEELPDSPEPKK